MSLFSFFFKLVKPVNTPYGLCLSILHVGLNSSLVGAALVPRNVKLDDGEFPLGQD